MKKKRVGCAIVQRALGANIDNMKLGMFNNWITHPTDDMELYKVDSEEELDRVIKINNEANSGRN